MYLLRVIAFPLSLLYAAVVHLRNYLYDINVFRSRSFETPTICIGNLNVGGSGKTPMTEYLIEMLKNEYRLAVLSRGYKRKSKGFLVARANSRVEDLGDEPYQLFKKFPEVTIAVDADRIRGISLLEQEIKPDIILLDDAFQHRRVKPGFSLLLTSYGNIYPKDWYLPTGNLRDGKREAKRADVIIVTKCPTEIDGSERKSIIDALRPKPHQKVLFCGLTYSPQLKGPKDPIDLAALNDKTVALVTGIADPDPLVDYLKDQNVLFRHLRYADHHFFSDSEVDTFKTYEVILTTEKDHTRLEEKLENLYYLEVRHHFSEQDALVLKNDIERYLKLCQ